jgi:hypothetical protein
MIRRRLTAAEREAFRARYGCEPPDTVTILPPGATTPAAATAPRKTHHNAIPPGRLDLVARMIRANRTTTEIAAAVGVAPVTVRGYVFRLGGRARIIRGGA